MSSEPLEDSDIVSVPRVIRRLELRVLEERNRKLLAWWRLLEQRTSVVRKRRLPGGVVAEVAVRNAALEASREGRQLLCEVAQSLREHSLLAGNRLDEALEVLLRFEKLVEQFSVFHFEHFHLIHQVLAVLVLFSRVVLHLGGVDCADARIGQLVDFVLVVSAVFALLSGKIGAKLRRQDHQADMHRVANEIVQCEHPMRLNTDSAQNGNDGVLKLVQCIVEVVDGSGVEVELLL